jgi:hypothetical protein
MERTTWTDERLDDSFALLRADIGHLRGDISRLEAKVDARTDSIQSELSSLKNALVVCACGIIAALIGSSAL